jgi:hypothetical protein
MLENILKRTINLYIIVLVINLYKKLVLEF